MSVYSTPRCVGIPTPPNRRTGRLSPEVAKQKFHDTKSKGLKKKKMPYEKVEFSESSHAEFEISILLSHSVTRMLTTNLMILRLEIKRLFSGKTDKPKRRGIKILVVQFLQQPSQFGL